MNYLCKLMLVIAIIIPINTYCNSIIIRHAEQNDLPNLINLTQEVFNKNFRNTLLDGYPESPIPQSPDLLQSYLNGFINAYTTILTYKLTSNHNTNHQILVAVDPQQPEHTLGLSISEKRDTQAYIMLIIVDPDYQGKGIGKTLLTQTIDLYDDVASCGLKTFSHGNENTHHFYETYGFKSSKELITLPIKDSPHSDTITFIFYTLTLVN